MSVSNNSESNVYRIKKINFNGPCDIVTQNKNGPCALLGLANVLLLRGSMSFAGTQNSTSSADLLGRVGDLLLSAPPAGALDIHARQLDLALTFLEHLPRGMEVDVKFNKVTSFAPTPGQEVFSILGVPLYHTWLRDPANINVVAVVGDLSHAELIDNIITYISSEDPFKRIQAIWAQDFLETAPNHMTTYGLEQLTLSIGEGQLGVLYRNYHFVTICKQNGVLYQLVTDEGYLDRDDIVWETLSTIDGVGKFVNHNFESENIITIVDDYESRENTLPIESTDVGLVDMGCEKSVDESCELTARMYKNPKVCPAGHHLKEVPVIIRVQEQDSGYGRWRCSSCNDDTLALQGTRFRCDHHKVKTQLTPHVVSLRNEWRSSMECDFDLCGECFYQKQTITDVNDNTKENVEYRNHVLENIKKLLLEHPNGIFDRNFTGMYRDAFGEKMDFQQLGYPKQTSNKSKFLQTLTGSILEMEYSSNSRLYIKPSKSLLSEIGQSQHVSRSLLDALELPDENLPNESVDNIVCGVRKQVQYPPGLKEGQNLDIIVTEVVSPTKFWFQLLGQETSEALESLMVDMESFYRNEEKNYRLDSGNPRDKCKPGVVMAAPYLDNESHDFHRVHINKICKNNVNKVEVFYLDYGTVERIPISCLRILHQKFSKLPAQALEGKLWGLGIPSGRNTWPKESAQRFLDLVGPLNDAGFGCYAIVKRIQTDSSNRFLHLELIDAVTTSSPEGLCINQQLVQEGLARSLDVNNNLFNENDNIEEATTVNNNSVVVSQPKFFINRVKVNENLSVNLLIDSGKTWLSSGDISALMPSWRGRDLLAKMIQTRKLDIDSLDIGQESDRFEQIMNLGIKPTEDLQNVNIFQLYCLRDVSKLITTFNKDPQNAKKIIEAIEMAADQSQARF